MYPSIHNEDIIRHALEDQFEDRLISPDRHRILIDLVDRGLLGMDGFKYCRVEEARDNWRRCHRFSKGL